MMPVMVQVGKKVRPLVHTHVARPLPAHLSKENDDFICSVERPFDATLPTTRSFVVWHDAKPDLHDGRCRFCGQQFFG